MNKELVFAENHKITAAKIRKLCTWFYCFAIAAVLGVPIGYETIKLISTILYVRHSIRNK